MLAAHEIAATKIQGVRADRVGFPSRFGPLVEMPHQRVVFLEFSLQEFKGATRLGQQDLQL